MRYQDAPLAEKNSVDLCKDANLRADGVEYARRDRPGDPRQGEGVQHGKFES